MVKRRLAVGLEKTSGTLTLGNVVRVKRRLAVRVECSRVLGRGAFVFVVRERQARLCKRFWKQVEMGSREHVADLYCEYVCSGGQVLDPNTQRRCFWSQI